MVMNDETVLSGSEYNYLNLSYFDFGLLLSMIGIPYTTKKEQSRISWDTTRVLITYVHISVLVFYSSLMGFGNFFVRSWAVPVNIHT